MSLATYTDLKTSIASWLARSDLTATIPDFITLAEAKFNRDLHCTQMEKRATAVVNLSNTEPQNIALPLDFQTMRVVRLNGVTGEPKLDFLSLAQADEFFQSVAGVTGQPRYFTVFGDEMLLIPSPDQAYSLEMIYRANIPALADNSTNWLLTLAPDAYLYGSLMEAAPFMQNDERIGVWATLRQSAVEGLNRLAQNQSYGPGPLAVRVSSPTP